MNMQTRIGTNVESLVGMLASKDGMVRQKARKSLVALGSPAVSSLAQALQTSELDQVRWEAAKALGAIGDSTSIPTLVRALEDSDGDVTWLAAEALRKFKKIAWPTLLQGLLKRNGNDSVLLRQGAHHVLRNQKEDGFNDLLATLQNALESNSSPESTLVAASNILKRMKTKI
jgi:HEAT repeats